MLPTKVEIKLKKAEAISWSRLEYPIPHLNSVLHSKDSETTDEDQISNNSVESVDLTDL